MIRSRGFIYVTVADFIARSAYQMGKTPLLPFYASTLGASDAFLGFIVSVSTLTGMISKPLVGLLSDRWGRRSWLIVGTIIFTGMPFLYRFVETPEQLLILRVIHGLATAIYGPVTLAYVAGLSPSNRAERLGWFAIARNGGYVVGPIAAGWMLLSTNPIGVFTIIGILSSLTFVPILLLPSGTSNLIGKRPNLTGQVLEAIVSVIKTRPIWLAGLLDTLFSLVLYAAKAFVPLYALSIGVNIVIAGAFFSLQETIHIFANPVLGRLSDRLGHLSSAGIGMGLLGMALLLLTIVNEWAIFLAPAVLIGLGQAFVFPSTTALASSSIDQTHLGTAMGMVGSLRNAGKVVGPVIAGIIIHWLDFEFTFRLLGIFTLACALSLTLIAKITRKTRLEENIDQV